MIAGLPALCINLDRRAERWQKFNAGPLAGKAERFRATDWKEISVPADWKKDPGGGYAGILSHMGAIRHAFDRGDKAVMIFEDDCIAPPWFEAEAERFISHLPDSWAIAWLGGFPNRMPQGVKPGQSISGPVYRVASMSWLECYCVSRLGMPLAIAALEQAERDRNNWAGVPLGWVARVFGGYCPLNPLCYQDRTWSDNWNAKLGGPKLDTSLIPGWFSLVEGHGYLGEVMRFPGGTVVELGTHMGRSASFVAEWIHAHKGRFVCVDNWSKFHGSTAKMSWWMWKAGLHGKYEIRDSDSTEAASAFADGECSLVFVDADHAEESVRKDINAWLPKIKKGGTICGHDYAHNHHIGVKRGVDGIFGKPSRLFGTLWVQDLP